MHTGIVHYSTDVIYLWTGGKEVAVPYIALEKTLPSVLVQRVEDNNIHEIVAINGPGGFTALRIGSLCLTMINTLGNKDVTLYEIDKISLYQYGFDNDILPSVGFIGIGQKKNMWLTKFSDEPVSTDVCNVGSLDEMNDITTQLYFVDQMKEHIFLETLLPSRQVGLSSKKNGLKLSFAGDAILIPYEYLKKNGPIEEVSPNYMIDPTLS